LSGPRISVEDVETAWKYVDVHFKGDVDAALKAIHRIPEPVVREVLRAFRGFRDFVKAIEKHERRTPASSCSMRPA
jgi:hypothetical protein